ncbi:hypothetical protein AAXB25_14825 [Paenibacillus lautus]|uniref:hypothetical protein n=1 Tax=Paenibacillus lautus TaxID=1401 RepID=UPI003D2B8658
MKTTNNNATQNQKAQQAYENSSSFEDILNQAFESLEKKVNQALSILQAIEHINETLEEKFDLILDTDLDITDCQCPKDCGKVKVSVKFIAMTFTDEGIGMHEGEMSAIIVSKG